MLKIVIADDEARVCSLIRMLIDWDALRLELAGVASNGIEALELIEKRQPDILITDIRMPGCSGLELIEQAKNRASQLEVIIISGYAHFEYAQSAIRFGVSDYLLKPINQQQLTDTLKKLADRCRSRRETGNEMEALRKSSKEDMQQLQSRLMRDLLSDSVDETDAESLWKKYRFRLEAGCLQLALVQIDYDDLRVSPTSLRIVEEKAAQMFSQELADVCQTLMIHISDGIGGLLLGFEIGEREIIRKRLRKSLNQLGAQRDLFGGAEFSMALSPMMENTEDLHDACADVHMILMERLTRGTGRILESLPPWSAWKNDEMLKPYRQAVSELAESQSAEAFSQAISLLEREVAAKQDIRGAEVFDMVRAAGSLFLQQPQVANGRKKNEAFAARIAHIGQMNRLFETLRTMLASEAEELIEQQRSANTRPIRLAKEYVLKHYREPITLEKVCEEVGFSVSYFSSLFKKETGENFVRFLTRTRMERARELLAQTNMPVSEICAQVGYSDLKYFTQTFKKETNLSPGQYRKLYG